MAKSAVIDDERAAEATPPNPSPLSAGAAGIAAAASQTETTPSTPAPESGDGAPSSGDSDASSAGMSADPQVGREQTPPPAHGDTASPLPTSTDQLERATTLAKLKILDWVRQKTRDDPASLALRMPYLQSRLKAWEDAKSSGDAGRMTQTYNHLLRGLEADQNRRGIPKEQQRVLPNEMAEDVARGILNAEPAKMLEKLRAAKAEHGDYADGLMSQIRRFLPEPLKSAEGQSSDLIGELAWRKTVAASGDGQLLPEFPSSDEGPTLSGVQAVGLVRESYSSIDSASDRAASAFARDRATDKTINGDKGAYDPSANGPPRECAALSAQLDAAKAEYNRADVMRANWALGIDQWSTKQEKLRARFERIYGEMKQIEERYGQRPQDPFEGPERPKPGEGMFAFFVRKFGWAVAIEMLKDRLRDLRVYVDKSSYTDELERLVEEQKEYYRELERLQRTWELENQKAEAAAARIDQIRTQMQRLGCRL